MQEARELANDPCTDYSAAPLEVCNDTVHRDLRRHSYFIPLDQDDIFVSYQCAYTASFAYCHCIV